MNSMTLEILGKPQRRMQEFSRALPFKNRLGATDVFRINEVQEDQVTRQPIDRPQKVVMREAIRILVECPGPI